MSEFFRFIWRGSLGGAIFPLLLFTYFWILPYGLMMIFYLAFYVGYLFIPGGIVGAILWLLCGNVLPDISGLRRLVIGAVTGSIITLLWSLYSSPGSGGGHVDVLEVIGKSFIYGTLVGAPAGLLSPRSIRIAEDSRPYDAVESFQEWTPPSRRQQ